MGFNKIEKKLTLLQKYRTIIITACMVFLIIAGAGAGYLYGKSDICKKSGGVLATVPGVGEQCVTNFIDAQDCRSIFAPDELFKVVKFCRDGTGLYPLGYNS